jgi:regulator of replication initiation timing
MQRIELKVYTYEKYLQRKALADKEALELLHKFEARVSGNGDRKVTNVVETNFNLRHELKEAMQEINALSLENAKLANTLKDAERTHKLYHRGGASSPVTEMDMY